MALRPSVAQHPGRGNRLVTAPAVEPVTATELRTQLKRTGDELPDAEAETLITEARQFIEEYSGLALITQTWRLTMDGWPGYVEPWWDGVREMAISALATGNPITLVFPRYPLSAVSSVKTYDEDDAETVVSISSTFNIDTEQRPGRMRLKPGQVWPSATRGFNAVQIDYVAGFGAAAGNVPVSLRGAVLSLAAYYYDHRGECDMTEAFCKSGADTSVRMHMIRGL